MILGLKNVSQIKCIVRYTVYHPVQYKTMPILPNDALDTLTCDLCHKCLSVGPVQVHSKGQMRCGRCPQADVEPLPGGFEDDNIIPQRNISLEAEFLDNHAEFTSEKSSTNSIILNDGQNSSELHFHCKNCETIFASGYFLQGQPKNYHSVCSKCLKYYRKTRLDALFIPESDLYSVPLLFHLRYACIWGCSELYDFPKIFDHEKYCNQQPSWTCPVSLCSYRSTLNNFEAHFEENHEFDRFSLDPIVNIFQIPNKLALKWYIWTRQGFLSMEVSRENSLYKMRLLPLVSSQSQPRGLLLDAQWDFVRVVKAGRFHTVLSEVYPSSKRHYFLYVYVKRNEIIEIEK